MTAVHLDRTVPAPPSAVYRAWLDPATMRRWFAPERWGAARAEVDEREGGRLAVWHTDADGRDAGGAEARIVELVPDARIVLDWWFVGSDRAIEPRERSRLTITLRPQGAGTHLTLVHDRLDGLVVTSPEVASGVQDGWDGALRALVGAVAVTA